MKEAQWEMNSKIGPLYLVVGEKGLKGIFWKEKKIPYLKSLKGNDELSQMFLRVISEIKEYLDGRRTSFSIPLDMEGTEFQKRVWKELSKIPYGETCSYKEIAEKLKDPKKARAVGSANGKNPVSLIVPCHRVINTGGKLGGYAGGLEIKKQLLIMEKKLSPR